MDLGGIKNKSSRVYKSVGSDSMRPKSVSRRLVGLIFIALVIVLVAAASYFAFFNKPSKEVPSGQANQDYENAVNNAALSSQQRAEAYKKSIASLEKTINANPNDVSAMLKVASAYYNTGEIDKAIITLQEAISIDGNNALVHNNLGNFYREKGDTKSSDAEYNKAIVIDPSLSSAYINLAVNLHDKEGKNQEAIAILQNGLANVPGDKGMTALLEEYNQQ